jgi:phage terminase large subunit GpA-like protein
MTAIATGKRPALEELNWFARAAQIPKRRSIRRFAEEEIIIPDGPYEGLHFHCGRQPYTRLFFGAVDSARYSRFWCLGPTQSGKTLMGFIVPLFYHLFEIGETVICGLPDEAMAYDKWTEDIKPILERTRYRDQVPTIGLGSRGGKFKGIRFRNGSTLRFMTGGSGDKGRAGFTARVVVITEVDGLAAISEGSHEADKIKQLIGRTRAFGVRARVYGECTATVEEGRICTEYASGTASKIALHCPLCGGYSLPTFNKAERELLSGWKDAANEIEAREKAAFSCAACGGAWSEDERRFANAHAVLVHRGQEIEPADAPEGESNGTAPEGEGEYIIKGEHPRTTALGFRWSAVNNLFVTAADVAADEWHGQRAIDEDNAERELHQYVWALPYRPPAIEAAVLNAEALVRRVAKYPRGLVPPWCEYLTAHVDCGKYLIYWMAVAWRVDGTGHVVDYGRNEVASDQLGVERGLATALREFRDMALLGWTVSAAAEGRKEESIRAGTLRIPDQIWIDAGWQTDCVYAFIRDCGTDEPARFRPAVGRGVGQEMGRNYIRPKKTGGLVRMIGEEYHVVRLRDERLALVEVNADHWKGWVQQRLSAPVDAAGALTLFSAQPSDHFALSKHLTAEHEVQEFVPGKGLIRRWVRDRRANHWLDCLYNCAASAHLCGVRLVDDRRTVRTVGQPHLPAASDAANEGIRGLTAGGLTLPDGRPFLVTERE